MGEPIFLMNRDERHPVDFETYRALGGYGAVEKALRSHSPDDVIRIVSESELRGRGGAGFPAGKKWSSVPADAPHPRYVVANTDEMEPGTFKDRVLLAVNPHLLLEGIILAGYAVSADHGIIFIRPSYEREVRRVEKAVGAARRAGFLGKHILGSRFSFDISVHRSGGRYICGEANAQLQAIQGFRPHPLKGNAFPTVKGLWDLPTLVNNVETLCCVAPIVRNGAEWFRGLAASASGQGPKLYGVSGSVRRPGVYELPMGTPLREIVEKHAGGMRDGKVFKTCLPGGASTRDLPPEHYDVAMDFDSLGAIGHRLGTASIIVFDRGTCLVGATLNMIRFFTRESCGFCTPCREGLPYVQELLWRIEHGEGRKEHVEMLRQMAADMGRAYCAFAPGAASPLESLLTYFEDEVREHISQGRCPFGGEYLHCRWPRRSTARGDS
jgi:NADH-quinone oxidoreductase subunit F